MANKDEDRALAKACRAAMARTVLDISEIEVISIGGFVELHGKARAPRGGTGTISVKKEFQSMIVVLRTVRGVKDVRGERVILIEST